MGKKKPGPVACAMCKYMHKEAMFSGGKLREWCCHPAWFFRALRKRWIKSAERGKTSPEWCPLRVRRAEHGTE